MTTTETIAQRNDRIRKNALFGIDHRHKLGATRGVQDLGEEAVRQLVADMVTFDDFTEDCDPHGHHDFGVLWSGKTKVWFKIDEEENGRLTFTLLLPDEW